MRQLFWIGWGGFLGATLRYLLSGWVARRFGEIFPSGTLLVNWSGCFLVGLLFFLLQERYLIDPLIRSFLLIGFLGSLTTFSSYGLQTLTLLRDGELLLAFLNILLSNAGGLALVWLGYQIPRLGNQLW